jgi:hypothetical protein
MNKNILSAGILFLIVALGAWISRHYGWYGEYWFVDIILHIISGIMFGLIWTVVLGETRFRSRWALVLSIVAFAALGSVIWEFWEFEGWRIMPEHTQYYVPALSDTLGDIASGIGGGAAVALAYLRSKRFLVLK